MCRFFHFDLVARGRNVVAQTSQSAVSRISYPQSSSNHVAGSRQGSRRYSRFRNLRYNRPLVGLRATDFTKHVLQVWERTCLRNSAAPIRSTLTWARNFGYKKFVVKPRSHRVTQFASTPLL